MKEILEWIKAGLIVMSPIIALVIVVIIYGYTQRYIKEDNYAKSGIIFTNQIDLESHRKIGKGSGLFGEYESYTRSDRQEFIKVYFK